MAFKRFWGALIGSATDAQSICWGGHSDSDIKGEGPNRIGPVVILCQSGGICPFGLCLWSWLSIYKWSHRYSDCLFVFHWFYLEWPQGLSILLQIPKFSSFWSLYIIEFYAKTVLLVHFVWIKLARGWEMLELGSYSPFRTVLATWGPESGPK